jgi:hypothetical protein
MFVIAHHSSYHTGGYGASTPNYPAIYTTLLEVAMALRHLHSLHLVHCGESGGVGNGRRQT